ncbi:MAG: HlyD family efflux transporter periplasmic adaptor subunit [Planctomycetota bacterium]
MQNGKRFFLACVGILFSHYPIAAQQETTSGAARLVALSNTIVSSESPGIVREVLAKPGANVAKSTSLIRLNDELFSAECDVARAELEIANLEALNRVHVEYANKSAEVAAAVLQKSVQANQIFSRSIPETEIQKLKLEWEQSRLSGEQASMEFDTAQWARILKERRVQAAKVRLDSRTVRAPFGGKVAQIYVQPGQWINAGEPIVRLLDSHRLRAEAYFNEDLIRQVKAGQRARFEYRLGGQTYVVAAEVTFVGVEIVEGIFQVWAEFENAKGLHLPGTEGRLILTSEND